MKRRSFLKNSAMAAGAASLAIPAMGSTNAAPAAQKAFLNCAYTTFPVPVMPKTILNNYIKECTYSLR